MGLAWSSFFAQSFLLSLCANAGLPSSLVLAKDTPPTDSVQSCFFRDAPRGEGWFKPLAWASKTRGKPKTIARPLENHSNAKQKHKKIDLVET